MAIGRSTEVAGVQPDYSGQEFSEQDVANGEHRKFVGGSWDTHGKTQLHYLQSRGLKPEHRLLDIGCGAFRAGRHFIDYLEPGHYFGIEANPTLIQTGYDRELSDEQRDKAPEDNFRITDRFWSKFGATKFDYALAQSVFTHISLNHIRLCLHRTAQVVKPGGHFYATFFERPDDTSLGKVFNQGGNRPFFTEKNAFWYYRGDLEWAASYAPWKMNYIGDWGHPAKQMMIEFVRMGPGEEMRWRQRRAAQIDGVPDEPSVRSSLQRLQSDLADLSRVSRSWVAEKIASSRS
ncbi:hypothetical protein GCM10011575_07090 [Microlunatus endophyticus]|uniref:Methyltransferase type 12 domain-containing protein n=1 Tax=Microlunatus endophyticus TaxID=1716077 RepID=A0A917S1P6_9ACTN|nr:class I SAM-dependent methyltransferase [Microlunatus endophyticus]GGL51345.1 hypothetical protein GCM10011575_07090 [Microlunatus endophyticus]